MIPLTETQKVQIRDLKSSGLGAKEIADKLNLSFESVKKHLQRHPVTDGLFCKCCGKPLEQKDKRKRLFCSKKCKDKYWHTKTTKCPEYFKEFVCIECGRTFFEYTSVARRYCSRICFQKHASRKWREANGKE